MITTRHVKKQAAKTQTLSIRCPKGLEDIALEDLRNCLAYFKARAETLPAEAAKLEQVETELVDKAIMVRNIPFRTAQNLVLHLGSVRDILWIIKDIRCGSVKELNQHLAKLEWLLYLTAGSAVSLRVDSYRSHVFHEGLIKEALTAALGKHKIKVLERDGATNFVEIKLNENRMQISVSLAGTPMYIRGFKEALTSVAPVKEDLANAAIGFALKWIHGRDPSFQPDVVYNPFAGSGTLAFEGLNRLQRIPPGVFLRDYGLETMPLFQDKSFGHERKIIGTRPLAAAAWPKVICVENAVEQTQSLMKNADSYWQVVGAPEESPFEIVEDDFFKCKLQMAGRVFLVANPPYGRRLDAAFQPEKFFRKIVSRIAELKIAAGLIFVPDDAGVAGLKTQLEGYQTSYRKITHGGLAVSLFVFAKN